MISSLSYFTGIAYYLKLCIHFRSLKDFLLLQPTMSEKDKTSDSGIDLKKSDSGSFAGVDKTSWNDFDDSGQGSSRRGTYDDDDDDDYDDEPQKVDLDAFISDDTPAGDDVGDEEEGEGEDEEEEEGDFDEEYVKSLVDEVDEGEYETEEEEDESNEQLPGEEILTSMYEWIRTLNKFNKINYCCFYGGNLYIF